MRLSRFTTKPSRHACAIILPALIAGFGTAYGTPKPSDMAAAQHYAAAAVHARTVADAHAELQRVLNCLVGKSGQGYDAATHDRCSNAGILAEAPRSSTIHIEAQKAAQIAEVGLSAGSLAMVRRTANAVDGLLHGKGVKGEYD